MMDRVQFSECDGKKLALMRRNRVFSHDAVLISNMLEIYSSYTNKADKEAALYRESAPVFFGTTPDFWDRYKNHIFVHDLRWALDLEAAHDVNIRRGLICTNLQEGVLVDGLVVSPSGNAVLKYATSVDSVSALHRQCEYEMGLLGLKKAFIANFDDAGNVNPKWIEISSTVVTQKTHGRIASWARAHFGSYHDRGTPQLTNLCREKFESFRPLVMNKVAQTEGSCLPLA